MYYQIGIIFGLILIIFAAHVMRKARKSEYPFAIIHCIYALVFSFDSAVIIVVTLAAIQPHNWYTSNALWRMLIPG